MAFYITPDGRVHTVEVEIKDGIVRPQSYHAFDNEISPERENYNSKVLHSNSVETKGEKTKQTITIIAEIERQRVRQLQKSRLAQYRLKLSQLLESSDLSVGAKSFVKNYAASMNRINMNKINKSQKLFKYFFKKGLLSESNEIWNILQQVNRLVDEELSSNTKPLQNNPKTNDYKSPPRSIIIEKESSKSVEGSKSRKQIFSIAESRDTSTSNYSRAQLWNSPQYVKKGKKSKYGYARDIFGRVVEKDRYREDREVNPYNSSSSYDIEDDNESLENLD